MSVYLNRNVSPTVAHTNIPGNGYEALDRGCCAGVEPEKLRRLDAIAKEMNFEPRQIIFIEGDPAAFVFSLTRGMVGVSKALPDGRRQITGFLYPGDFLGISLHNAHVYSAEALTGVTLRRFPRSKLRTLFDEFPTLEIHLLSLTANELAAAQDQMLLLGRKSAQERVASFLLMLARRANVPYDPGRSLELPMSRLDIADYLGLSAETVSRTFSTFRARGLIDYVLPTMVSLQQPELLETIAEGNACRLIAPAATPAWG